MALRKTSVRFFLAQTLFILSIMIEKPIYFRAFHVINLLAKSQQQTIQNYTTACAMLDRACKGATHLSHFSH